MKTLSIVIPFFNTDIVLFKRCLDSVCCAAEEVEVIVVDDGSGANSQQELDACLAAQSTAVKLYTKTNGGQNSARFYGASKAQGKYLFFLDSDDYVNEAEFLSLIQVLKTSEAKK